MGYTTEFYGSYEISPPLTDAHRDYLLALAHTRRMKRDPDRLPPDPIREAVGLPPGDQGEYFVSGLDFMGQGNDPSIIDYNQPPGSQPELWNHWLPNSSGTYLECADGKAYQFEAWLKYVLDHFLIPWGYTLNGVVEWEGEETGDIGQLHVTDNKISIAYGNVVWTDPTPYGVSA